MNSKNESGENDSAWGPGDHICYISNLSKLKSHFPDWSLTRKFDDILEEMVKFEIGKES